MKLNAVTPSARQMSQKREAEKRSWRTHGAPVEQHRRQHARVARIDVEEREHVEEHLVLAVAHQLARCLTATRKFALWLRARRPSTGPVVPDVKRITDGSRRRRRRSGRACAGASSSAAYGRQSSRRPVPRRRRPPAPASRAAGQSARRARATAPSITSSRSRQVFEHVREHVAAEPGVQRHLDDARPRHPEPEPEVLGPVAEHDRDPVARPSPRPRERVRDAARALVEPPVRHGRLLEADDRAVGLLLGARREDRADRPLTVVHGAPSLAPSRQRLELAQRLGPALAGLEPPHRVRVDFLPQQPDRLRRRRLGDRHAAPGRRARSRSPRRPPHA